MSSEGSVSTSTSSRIRQFGLYRTIDARTEEFLRLSRKRQIKQGCACAAISTAITVTVVITFFLVYMEYGMNSDANQQSLAKAGWIGLLNDSFEEKFTKSKINFDRNTIKLLPILIKALKQNRYLEKILEDYSSSSPTYDGKVTTEFSFKKDIFLNSKSWMKKPSSRLYTIEYKTSPIVFVKNPSKEPGYFTKNRKIRDYKRIMEYVEKMINDKVGIGSTVTVTNKNSDVQTENLIKESHVTSKPTVEIKFNKKYRSPKKKSRSQTNQDKFPKAKQDEIISCKCPKQLGILLDKIFSSIQQLIPDDKITKSGPCSENQNTNTPEPNSNKAFHPPKLKLMTTSPPFTSNAKISIETKQKLGPVQFSEFGNIFHKFTKILNTEATTVSTNYFPTETLRLPFFNSRNTFETNGLKSLSSLWDNSVTNRDISLQTTTVYDHIEPTESYYDTTITTQPMPSTIDKIERKNIHNLTTETEKNLLLQNDGSKKAENETIQSSYLSDDLDKASQSLNLNSDTINHTHTEQPESKKNHSTATTTDNVFDMIDKFDVHSFELLKSNLISPNKRIIPSKDSSSTSIEHEYGTTEISTEDATVTLSTENPITSTKTYLYSYVAKTITNKENDKTINQTAKSNGNYKFETQYTIMSKNATKKNAETSTHNHDKNKKESFYLGLENTALEDEIEKMTRYDEYQEELNLKQTEKKPSFFPVKNSTSKLQDTTGTDFLQILKNNERYFGSNSMLPHNRPTYLEIHRNDWKHEENKDYDTEMKYNVFDLL